MSISDKVKELSKLYDEVEILQSRIAALEVELSTPPTSYRLGDRVMIVAPEGSGPYIPIIGEFGGINHIDRTYIVIVTNRTPHGENEATYYAKKIKKVEQ